MQDIVKNKMRISFDSNWFKSKYYVYVITVHHKQDTHFYIGQTGDRKHIAARSPFYRLWGHHNPYNSKSGTDSQLMKNLFLKGILEDIQGLSRREIIDHAISSQLVSISTQFYPIAEFTRDNKKEHSIKRKHTEAVEVALINLFDGKLLFNNLDKIGHKKVVISAEELEMAKVIYKDVMRGGKKTQ